jgi:hypothetical protein
LKWREVAAIGFACWGVSDQFGKFIRLDTGMAWLSRRARGAARTGKQRSQTALAMSSSRRRHLLDEIAAFLLTYELDVTPNNLLTAHGAFSGPIPPLRARSPSM